MGERDEGGLQTARGDATGVMMPACPDSFRAMGADFLTEAFRAYGILPQSGHVVAIDRCEHVSGGNSGQKLRFDVTYEGAPVGVPTQLFAKFSRDFDDAFRDRRRDELDGEIRLAALSRLPGFPVTVTTPLFGDFEAASGTGLLITERIPFGEGAIEPLWRKCKDHLLPEPLEHYRTLVSAQARLAAAHHTGQLSPQIEALFPFDRAAAEADLPVTYDEAGLHAKVAAWTQFLLDYPQLFPDALRTPEWRDRFAREALALYTRQGAIRRFLYSDPRLVALSHWNTNIDNAWFWREADGALHCGLLDWGMVRIMNVTTGLWGGLSAATSPFLARELDGLLAYYADELERQGGPAIEPATLGRHFDMSLALTGLALMMDLPALVTARLPDLSRATGPLDPMINDDPVVQGFQLVCTNFLMLWEQRRFGDTLAQFP